MEGVLSILLPTEDLENPCLTGLVSQILSELIIGNLFINKASQPWLLLESICIVSRVLGEKKTQAKQRIVSRSHQQNTPASQNTTTWSIQGILFTMFQLGILIFSSIQVLIKTIVMSSSLPSRFTTHIVSKVGVGSVSSDDEATDVTSDDKVAVLDFKLWTCIGNLIDLSSRMPWLSGFLSLLQHQAIHGPGRVAQLDTRIDR